MLTIPSVATFEEVVIFPDDEDPNLYYLIPTVPRLSRMDNSDPDSPPVFNGLFWTDKLDGSLGSTAGIAGAWINFDVNLGITEEKKDTIRTKLVNSGIQEQRRRNIIKMEQERLAVIARARESNNIPEPDVPKVGPIRFGTVNFTGGTVTLLMEEGTDFVPYSSGGGPASLIGNNNAAFSLRLNHTAAAIWYKALKTDDLAISVRYDLKFMVRLPSLEIRAWAGNFQEYEMERKIKKVTEERNCAPDVHTWDTKEITEDLMEESIINIEVKKGSSEISDEHVAQLRSLAFSIVEEKVKGIILNRISKITPAERRNSALEYISDESRSFVELRFSQKDVVEWNIAPQATIMNFVPKKDREDEELREGQLRRLVDLSHPEVEVNTIEMKVDAPWDEAPFVSTVKLNFSYPSAGAVDSELFSKEKNEFTWRIRKPKQDDGVVKYNAEVYFKGFSEPLILKERKTNGNIVINVGKVGIVDLTFKPHPVLSLLSGNNRITGIQINAKYKKENEEGHFVATKAFRLEDQEGVQISKTLGKTIDAPLYYTTKYFTKGGITLEIPEKKYWISENDRGEIYTASPFEDNLDIYVELGVSTGDDLKKIIVEFNYEDQLNDFECTDKVVLAKEDDWDSVKATLPQMNKSWEEFKYRYKVIGENQLSNSGWITAHGDQTIILPILPVTIETSRLGMGSKYMTAVIDLTYETVDGDQTIKVNHQLFLMAGDPNTHKWYIPRSNDLSDEYTYSLTLFPMDGDPLEYLNLSHRGRFLILQDPEKDNT